MALAAGMALIAVIHYQAITHLTKGSANENKTQENSFYVAAVYRGVHSFEENFLEVYGTSEQRIQRTRQENDLRLLFRDREKELAGVWSLGRGIGIAVQPIRPEPELSAFFYSDSGAVGEGTGTESVYVPPVHSLVYESGVEQWRSLVSQYDWDVDTVLRIMGGPWPCPTGESGGNPNVTSPDGKNIGLMQINVIHLWRVGGDVNLLYVPEINIRVAYEIYVDNNGFGPWSCYKY